MANDLINYAYIMKPPKGKKKAEGLGSESLWVGEHLEVRERSPWSSRLLPHTFPYASLTMTSELCLFIINQ